MEVEDSFPTLGGIYFLPGTQINSWVRCGTQNILDVKTGSSVLANENGIIVLERDKIYCPDDVKNRGRSMSRASISEDLLNYSSKTLHPKQSDQNWFSKSIRKLSIAPSTPPNLSSLKLDKTEPNYITEDSSSSKNHNISLSVNSNTSAKEKNTLFQSIRFKIKKNQQYHSNDILNSNIHDEISTKAYRRCSNIGYGTLGRKDFENNKKLKNSLTCRNLEAELRDLNETISSNNKKIINSDEYKPKCFRAGLLENSISKNFAIVGNTVTHEYLPEMDIVCGYVQLEFENVDTEERFIPVYAMLYNYELLFFENDKCKDEIFRITTETCSAYNEPKFVDIKLDFFKDGKSEKGDKKSKYEKNKNENKSKDFIIEEDKGKDSTEEDFSFTVSTSQGVFKMHTINNSSMIRWMATINTASSNIALALHLSSKYQQNSESVFDENDHCLDIYNKEYITLVRDFNYSKVDINKEIIKNSKNCNLEVRLPSPTIHGSPIELMNQNIPIIEITSKDDEHFDKDSIISRKKKNKICDLEARFKNIEITTPESTCSLEHINANNFIDYTKLNSPFFNTDCISLPSLNKKDPIIEIEAQNKKSNKENDEKNDVLGEINGSPTKHCNKKSNRLSSATVTSVNSYNSRCNVEDDIHFEDNTKTGNTANSIYCATPERLIECIWAGEETPENDFLDILIYTYRHFTTAEYIMDKLISKFQEKLPSNANSFLVDDFLLWKPIIMIRIAFYIKKWLTLSSIDFRVESVRKKLDSFISILSNISVFENGEHLYTYMLYKDLISLQKMFTKFTAEILKEVDLSPIDEYTLDKSKKLPEFINLDPTTVAYKLTAMEAERFQNIKPIEFLLNLWNTNDESPYIKYEMRNLKKMVEASNHLSYWVATEILTQPQLKPRAKVLEMFIKIAHICKKLNNYQTLFSICSGLGHSQVTRLKMTWEAIQPKYKSRFNELERITSIARNYNNYRQIHANLLEKDKNTSQYIPFIALLIKDLYFFNDGNPKYIDESKLKSLKNEDTDTTTNESTTLQLTKSFSNASTHAASVLGSSLKSNDNETTSFLTSSTSNFSINQDFGLESIDEVESNSSQFDKKDDGSLVGLSEKEGDNDDENILLEVNNAFKSEGNLPQNDVEENQVESLTNKVLSVESTTSTVTVTTTNTNQMINFDKLRKIMEQIRKIEHCQRQSKNIAFNNLSVPVEDVELPCNYYHILNNDKILNKYSLLCEQREGEPVRMVSKWIQDNK